jgi:ribonuclease E
VENRLRDALKHDRARVQTGKISRFGLMELSRQRLQPALSESSYIPCPRCHGVGHIRDTASSALHVLRIIQEEAMKESTAAVHCQVPVDVATFLLNEKRQDIHAIEVRFKVNVLLIPNVHIETPNYQIERLRHDSEKLDVVKASYELVNKPVDELALKLPTTAEAKPSRPEPVVKGITPDQPAPMSSEPVARVPRQAAHAPLQPASSSVATPLPSLWKRFVGLFGGEGTPAATAPVADTSTNKDGKTAREGSHEASGDRNNRGERADRGDRNDRGPRNRNDRGDRNERSNKGERKDGKRAEGRNEPRSDRPPRTAGSERNQPQRQNKPEGLAEATGGTLVQATQAPRNQQPRPALEARPPETSEDAEGRGRRRRGRGGRGRGGREQGDNRNTSAPQDGAVVTQVESAAMTSDAAEFSPPAMSASMAPAPLQQPGLTSATAANAPVSAPSAAPAMPAPVTASVAAAAAPVNTPAPAPKPAPSAMVYSSATAPLAPVDQIPDVAPVRSQPRPRRERNGAGQEPLVFIETDAGKAAATSVPQATLSVIEPQRRSAPRPRRARVVIDEPLQAVETKTEGPPRS